MNWLTSVVRPKIRSLLKRETPENMWIKCPETGQLVFYKDVEANQFVIPSSNYHMRMSATARLKSMFDGETWFDIGVPDVPVDPALVRSGPRVGVAGGHDIPWRFWLAGEATVSTYRRHTPRSRAT